jgi:pimeloyl-ACP methyl ester carboxylesterase
MNREIAALAAALSGLALFLPTRSQTFTRVVVDGRTTRMLVAGSGSATVVFENGYTAPLETWGRVQPEVSKFARTVAYDRAGLGLSEPGPSPRDGRRIAAELHGALQRANVLPPYILVGHSLGGLFVREFAGMYPDEVAGMVLVDPTHEAEALESASTLPEWSSMPVTVAQVRASAMPVAIPVTLISAMGPSQVPFTTRKMRASSAKRRAERLADSLANEAWLRGVPGGRFIVTHRNGHNVPQEEPELVIRAIREVVEGRRVRR